MKSLTLWRHTVHFKMTEWLQSKLSERFHSIMKEPQTPACGYQFRIGKNIKNTLT